MESNRVISGDPFHNSFSATGTQTSHKKHFVQTHVNNCATITKPTLTRSPPVSVLQHTPLYPSSHRMCARNTRRVIDHVSPPTCVAYMCPPFSILPPCVLLRTPNRGICTCWEGCVWDGAVLRCMCSGLFSAVICVWHFMCIWEVFGGVL